MRLGQGLRSALRLPVHSFAQRFGYQMPVLAAAVGPRASAAAPPPPAAPAAACRPLVAVVGAGYAGLAAALTLQRSRCCDVVVLEAGSRPGGRAHTRLLSPDLALECGATWFHGLGTEQEPNPVFRHAVEQGLIEDAPEGETWWTSQFVLPGARTPLTSEQQAAITHTLAAWGEVVEELPTDAAGTTADHLRGAWRELLRRGAVAEERLEVAQRAWRWRELLQRAMDGCETTVQQRAQGLALYDEMPGGVHVPLPAGMQTVAERLAGQLADLRYDHPVQRIRWGGGPDGVQIACANGVTLQADAVVVTASLGVLKAQHGQLFEPPLPGHKRAAIERLRIGTVDKLFLDFTPPASGGGSSSAASQQPNGAAAEASTEQASGAEQVVSYALLWGGAWDGDGSVAAPLTAAEAQLPEWARGIFSIRFGGPEVKQRRPAQKQQSRAVTGGKGETTQDRQRDAPEFSPCAAPAQPTCYQAVAWITGEAAAAMEAASDEEVLGVLRRLASVFPQLQLPPGASWDTVTLHRSSWGSDPLFRGSYSYLGPDATPADVAALAAPLQAPDAPGSGSCRDGAPTVLFAGEACHVQYIGTMHGAYLTGQQQAEALLAHMLQLQQRCEQRLASQQSAVQKAA